MGSLPNTVARYDGSPEPYKLVQDRKRDIDHRSKYALGATVTMDGGRPNQRAIQPVKALTKFRPRKNEAWRHKGHPRYAIRDTAILTFDAVLDSDSSRGDAFDSPDAEIAYSFDSTCGPSEGGDVLSAAINKAVERFETKETEKLVKDEYYVLDDKDTEVGSGYFGDDDFEWV